MSPKVNINQINLESRVSARGKGSGVAGLRQERTDLLDDIPAGSVRF